MQRHPSHPLNLPLTRLRGGTLLFFGSARRFIFLHTHFSKLKADLRRAAEKTVPGLLRRIGRFRPAEISYAMRAMFGRYGIRSSKCFD
jgi:hypothetical protein